MIALEFIPLNSTLRVSFGYSKRSMFSPKQFFDIPKIRINIKLTFLLNFKKSSMK